MSKSRLVSGRIKKATGTELSTDRYEYLDLANAEPDLGVPAVDESVLIGDINGTRTWVDIATYADEFKGFTGSQGDVGFVGSQGDQGFTGSSGTDGIVGSDGAQGDQGFTGSQGDVGFTGSQGIQGPTGEGGATGADGILGFTGSQGEVGFTGSQGSDGFEPWIVLTENHLAANRQRLIANAALGSFTITLPVAPLAGDYLQITDGANFAITPVTVARNGSTIEYNSDDVLLDLPNSTFEFIYDGGTWQITSTTGPQGFTGSQGAGFTGSQGAGFTGSQGIAGEFAAVGFTGSQGDTGFVGSHGDTGFVGSAGISGFSGGFLNMVIAGDVTPPFVGSARGYPPETVTVTTVLANISDAPSSGNLTFIIKKNGVSIGTTFTLSSALMTPVDVNFTLTAQDYVTIDVDGVPATNLHVRLKYIT